jgi:hypothetical protein
MKLIDKKRRVINIPKNDYETIKKYCDTNAFTMYKWLVKIALETIKKEKDNL